MREIPSLRLVWSPQFEILGYDWQVGRIPGRVDNLLRRAEGQGWKGFWPCSGRIEVVVLFGMLSLAAQFVYWSRIVSGLNQEHA